jgi:hypothetical protein
LLLRPQPLGLPIPVDRFSSHQRPTWHPKRVQRSVLPCRQGFTDECRPAFTGSRRFLERCAATSAPELGQPPKHSALGWAAVVAILCFTKDVVKRVSKFPARGGTISTCRKAEAYAHPESAASGNACHRGCAGPRSTTAVAFRASIGICQGANLIT